MSEKEGIGSRLGLVSGEGELTGRGRLAGGATFAAITAATGGDKFSVAGAAAQFIPPPGNLAAQLGLSWLQGRAQDREARRQRLAQIHAILRTQRRTALGTVAILSYGQSAGPGVAIHAETNLTENQAATANGQGGGVHTGMPKVTVSQASRQLGTMTPTAGAGDALRAFSRHVVYADYCLAYGEIDGLRDILVNGESVSFAGTSGSRKYDGVFTAEFCPPGTASELGTAFCGGSNGLTPPTYGSNSQKRTAQSVGNNLSRASCFFNLHRDGEVHFGRQEPQVEFLMRGRKLRTVNASNQLTTSRTYTANMVWCILDFLIDPIVGLARPLDGFDWERIALCAEQNHLIEGTGARADVGTQMMPPEDVLTGIASETYGQAWRRTGFTTNDTMDPATDQTGDRATAQPRAYHHEVNMSLTDVSDGAQVLLQMAASCPQLVIARDGRGRVYFDLPDWTRSASEVRSHVITENELRAYPRLDEENDERLVTEAMVTFDGINKDFAQQGAIFPTPGGTAAAALLAKYKGKYQATVHVPGIMDKAHAFSFGGGLVAQSIRHTTTLYRRADIPELDVGKPVQLNSPTMGILTDFRLLSRNPVSRDTTAYTAIEYVPSDYAPRLDNKDAFELEDAPDPFPAPATVMVDVVAYKVTPGEETPNPPDVPAGLVVHADGSFGASQDWLNRKPIYNFLRETCWVIEAKAFVDQAVDPDDWTDPRSDYVGIVSDTLFARSETRPKSPNDHDASDPVGGP